MDELQAGVEPALAVLPQAPVLLQPREAALDDPALGHDLEGVQFAPLGNLHCDVLAHNLSHPLRKGLARVAAVGQHICHFAQPALAALECLQCTLAVCDVRCGDSHRMRQSQRIHRNMALDTRDLLACVIAFEARRISVLHALRVHDQERAAGVAPQFLAGRANLIF